MLRYMDEKTKKMLVILVGLIIFMIAVFLIVFIVGRISNSSLDYSEIEDKMVSATEEYFKDNKSLLPVSDEEVGVDVSTLVNSGYMKELKKYQKDKSISCTGRVVVTKTGDYYNYSPYLNCGNSHTTKHLYNELISSVVSDGDGLYKTEQYYDGSKNDVYIYRGEYPNNYVSIDDSIWRIVKINNDNSIMIIQSSYKKSFNEQEVWDNRYNINTDTYEGINTFEKSRIKTTLDNYYKNNNLVSDQFRSNIVPRKVCISGRNAKDTTNDGSIECNKMSDYLVYFSLLQTNDFINASLDSNCKKIEDESCANYNYLNKFGKTWWFLTVNNRYYNVAYGAGKRIFNKTLSDSLVVRVVTNLNKNVVYKSGNGTYKDPYIIK